MLLYKKTHKPQDKLNHMKRRATLYIQILFIEIFPKITHQSKFKKKMSAVICPKPYNLIIYSFLYFQIAFLPSDNIENSYKRTAVHKNSTRPYFDDRFDFDLSENSNGMRVQFSVWHRDRECK